MTDHQATLLSPAIRGLGTALGCIDQVVAALDFVRASQPCQPILSESLP